jgi:hypothetical protein
MMAMEQDGITFFGHLDTPFPPEDLASALEREGIAAEMRESSHYTGGHYLRIHTGGPTDLSLERSGGGEYIVRADSDEDEALAAAARLVSTALGRQEVRHRFELYGPGEAGMEYLHHDWPAP